jgi:uncharacterized protein
MHPSLITKMAGPNDSRFAYNNKVSLDIQEMGKQVFDGKVVHEINFRGATERRINAYLVMPIMGLSFPGIVFVHPSQGSKKTFLNEALMLADRKICSIIVDAPWSAGMERAQGTRYPKHDRTDFIGTIKDLRRTFDVLTSKATVDPGRLGFVGHSLGALCGAVLSGIDRRVKTYVLMSGTSSFADVAQVNITNMKDDRLDHYRKVISDIDPTAFVSRAAPASILFQMGRDEENIIQERMRHLAHAASEPKLVQWYEAGHMLNEVARQDRGDWLVDELVP